MNNKENSTYKDFKVVDSLAHVINRAAIMTRKNLTARFKEKGVALTPEEFAILSRLWEADGLFQTEITEKTLKDKTRVTRLLGRLIEKSLIEKETDEADRRNFRIFLTKKGSALKGEVLPIIIELMDQASYHISSLDLEITKKTLRQVLLNFNEASSS